MQKLTENETTHLRYTVTCRKAAHYPRSPFYSDTPRTEDGERSEIRLTQFADDTQLLADSYDSVTRAMHLLEYYGLATGARVNTAKSVIIRMGALRQVAIPEHPATALNKTLGEGEYATILGVPFWESQESEVFWEKLYAKLKRK
eukprot:scaffold256933_cov28-Tisochrysis_lutea.AAC.4